MAGLWYLTEFFQAGSFTLSPATFLDGAQESPPWRTPPTFFLFCLTPHWDPAPTLILLSGACPFHFSVGTKWPAPTHPTLTEEESKHRHNILHVCMAHRESLPSHLCGLISLSFSLFSFLCFSLYTLCSCLKMLNMWWVPLSSPHARGADQTRLGLAKPNKMP